MTDLSDLYHLPLFFSFAWRQWSIRVWCGRILLIFLRVFVWSRLTVWILVFFRADLSYRVSLFEFRIRVLKPLDFCIFSRCSCLFCFWILAILQYLSNYSYSLQLFPIVFAIIMWSRCSCRVWGRGCCKTFISLAVNFWQSFFEKLKPTF